MDKLFGSMYLLIHEYSKSDSEDIVVVKIIVTACWIWKEDGNGIQSLLIIFSSPFFGIMIKSNFVFSLPLLSSFLL